MGDPIDRANEISEDFLERSIHAARGITPISVDMTKDSADNCAECGLQIPSARQLAVPGCQYCASCADDLEKRARRAGL
jgi:phage/conjugal plasmid C-4 type zinc finger TraR family protein